MGSISDYLENKLLDHVLGNTAYTPAATIYLALCDTDPTDAAADDGGANQISEPAGNGYTRKAITFDAAASRAIANALVTFDQASGAWGDMTHFAICSVATAGTGEVLAHGALSETKSVVSGNTPSVAAGQATISFNAGAVADYLANKLLDFAFRNQAFTQPTIYAAVTTATIGDTDTGSTITEPAAGAYARKAHAAWDAAAAGASENTGALTFATATASWGTIVAGALLDALSAGNLLVYDNDVADQAVGTDDVVEFADGAFDVSLS